MEAWGWRGTTRTSVVYGVIERTGVAAGTVLGVTGAWLAGALPKVASAPEPGAGGLGAVVEPVAFLAELRPARREGGRVRGRRGRLKPDVVSRDRRNSPTRRRIALGTARARRRPGTWGYAALGVNVLLPGATSTS